MIEKTIFYSWQSDLNPAFNWKIIERCLSSSIEKFNRGSNQISFSLDQATRGLPGSPDIVDSIFNKIEKSSIFIADITPIASLNDKRIPNPNVLIELGYAVNAIGWDNIICILNESYGKVGGLPFDIKHRRITKYSLNKASDTVKREESLIKIFDIANPTIQETQSEFDEITQIFKLELDHILLSLTNHFNLIFRFKESLIGIEVFDYVLDRLDDGLQQNSEIKIEGTEEFLLDKIHELKEMSKHPLLILNKKNKANNLYNEPY